MCHNLYEKYIKMTNYYSIWYCFLTILHLFLAFPFNQNTFAWRHKNVSSLRAYSFMPVTMPLPMSIVVTYGASKCPGPRASPSSSALMRAHALTLARRSHKRCKQVPGPPRIAIIIRTHARTCPYPCPAQSQTPPIPSFSSGRDGGGGGGGGGGSSSSSRSSSSFITELIFASKRLCSQTQRKRS